MASSRIQGQRHGSLSCEARPHEASRGGWKIPLGAVVPSCFLLTCLGRMSCRSTTSPIRRSSIPPSPPSIEHCSTLTMAAISGNSSFFRSRRSDTWQDSAYRQRQTEHGWKDHARTGQHAGFSSEGIWRHLETGVHRFHSPGHEEIGVGEGELLPGPRSPRNGLPGTPETVLAVAS